MQVLDAEATAILLEAAKATPIHLLVFVAVTTGLRRGEVLALRWVDVDLETATLHVNRSLEETGDGLRLIVRCESL